MAAEVSLLPTLTDFLAALRFGGIPIGPHELVWLQHAFAQEPELDRDRLKNLLACTLTKHSSQRETFDALFDDWCPPELSPVAQPTQTSEETEQPLTTDQTSEKPSPPDQQLPAPAPTIEQFRPPPNPRYTWNIWTVSRIVGACLILGALAYSLVFNQTKTSSKDIPNRTVVTASQSSGSDSQQDALPL